MVRQISVGLDDKRAKQLHAIYEHLSGDSLGEVTESDVMRKALDALVLSLLEEVPTLKELA